MEFSIRENLNKMWIVTNFLIFKGKSLDDTGRNKNGIMGNVEETKEGS